MTINYGVFINAVISFLIVAFAVFMVVRSFNKLKRQEEAAPEAPPAPPEPSAEEKLLGEIRDLLEAQSCPCGAPTHAPSFPSTTRSRHEPSDGQADDDRRRRSQQGRAEGAGREGRHRPQARPEVRQPCRPHEGEGRRGGYAELLEASGVDSVPELSNRNPENLAARMARENAAKRLVRAVPSAKTVARWVALAKGLGRAVHS